MKNTKHYITIFLGYFLLFLFIGYYGSMTMYYHAHLVNNRIVVHSHPYKHDPLKNIPFQSHSHSTSAHSIIKQLNQMSWDDVSMAVQVPEPPIFSCHFSVEHILPFIGSADYQIALLRAPPAIG